MQKGKLYFKSIRGFSTVEVVLALALVSIIALTLAGSLSYGIFAQSQANMENKANFLLEEGIEAVTSIKDNSYLNLTNGTYGLALTAGSWAFAGTSDSVDGFTRTVQITTVDSYTKQVTVTISWQNSSSSRAIDATIQLTSWERPTATNETWANVSLESGVDLTGNTDGVEVLQFGNKMFVARSGSASNFTVIDISNLSSPVIQGTISITGTLSDIAAYGNYVYLTSSSDTNELNIVNVTDPNAPSLTTVNMNGTANANGVYVLNNILYLTRSTSAAPELYIYDLTNPASPLLVGSAQIAANIFKLFVEGNYAYLASSANNAELTIYDISTPSLPTFASGLDLATNTDATDIARYSQGVALQRGTTVSLASITNPLAPTALNSTGFAVGATSLSIAGDVSLPYIFQADATASQLTIYDVTNAASPTVYGSFNYTGNLNDIFYNPLLDRLFGVGSNNTQEVLIYKPN